MSFVVERREVDGVEILAPQGRMVLGDAIEKMRERFEHLLAAGHTKVALDCSHVEYIDSSALGCLVMAHTNLEKAGGTMVLFALNQRNTELLVITKLATVMQIADSEQDAINLCYPGRGAQKFDILDFVTEQRARRRAARKTRTAERPL